ncbi:MAG: hypothetical protein CVU56_19065 [Deltaproteobacteria bacterium HGW-Deltaproteobacteria-14]|nr:MAG: hypothetical protein CVU56_19065 [Deltaproteobacteria bacterium HGW-Deltaproteobacteria-14]
MKHLAATLVVLALAPCACAADADPAPTCALAPGSRADYLRTLGCPGDFSALASVPLAAAIPGARSVKTVIDRTDDGGLYFQDTATYRVHWDFCRRFLSGSGHPVVPDVADFSRTEYYSPYRRFVLGALTHYADPDVWVYEIAPYDTADAAMVADAYRAIAAATWLGPELRFHPTSTAVEAVAAALPADVPVITTDALLAGVRYQPLNPATAVGRLHFATVEQATSGAVDFRDVVVLDRVPNDIPAVAGIITAELQTPLSHVNVLSQNRGTPNMALLGALDDPRLTALAGLWVELVVAPDAWSVREVDLATADAWWAAHKPTPVAIPAPDLDTTELRATASLLDVAGAGGLGPALAAAIPAFGGKASHYAALTGIGDAVPVVPGFAIPLAWYHRHLVANGLDAEVAALLADPDFTGDPAVRAPRLAELRAAIATAPVDDALLDLVMARLAADLPGRRARFRSSTNAEDLDGFTGAGLYTSVGVDPEDGRAGVADGLRAVWASTWNLRAFEERSYRSIDHRAVGMAVLVHPAFTSEVANGVAITANTFDAAGIEPGFVINVQKGASSVVRPAPGVLSDYFIYFYAYPNQPIVYLTHSNLTSAGATVLTPGQVHRLGQALDAIHRAFSGVFRDRAGSYAMDIEFKLGGQPDDSSSLWIKQARPYGRVR